MDNNQNQAQMPQMPPVNPQQPVQPLPTQQPPVAPVNPAPQPTTPQATPPKSSSKLFLWIFIGLLLVVFLAGGVYLYMVRQQANTVPQNPSQSSLPSPTAQENLEDTLNSVVIDTATDSADFTSVDTDINQL